MALSHLCPSSLSQLNELFPRQIKTGETAFSKGRRLEIQMGASWQRWQPGPLYPGIWGSTGKPLAAQCRSRYWGHAGAREGLERRHRELTGRWGLALPQIRYRSSSVQVPGFCSPCLLFPQFTWVLSAQRRWAGRRPSSARGCRPQLVVWTHSCPFPASAARSVHLFWKLLLKSLGFLQPSGKRSLAPKSEGSLRTCQLSGERCGCGTTYFYHAQSRCRTRGGSLAHSGLVRLAAQFWGKWEVILSPAQVFDTVLSTSFLRSPLPHNRAGSSEGKESHTKSMAS